MELSLSANQIENCLPKLQAMAQRKRELIAQHQAEIDSNPPPKPQKPLVKLNIDKQQFKRFPVKFFWTTEGKLARYYQYEFPKPCLLCDSYAKIEIVDKYSTVQLCELHGLQVAQKLRLKVTELPTTSKPKTRNIMSNKRIDDVIRMLEKIKDKREDESGEEDNNA